MFILSWLTSWLYALAQFTFSLGKWSPFGITPFDQKYGVCIEGDPKAPPTTARNHAEVVNEWQRALLLITGEHSGLWLTYFPTNGHMPMKARVPPEAQAISVGVGHENVAFQVTDAKGKPVSVTLIGNYRDDKSPLHSAEEHETVVESGAFGVVVRM